MAVTVDNTKGAYTIPALSGSGYVPIGGGTMTGALTIASGTLTASAPALNITQTWNAGAIGFTGVLIDITNTVSGTSSSPLVINLNGSLLFSVTRLGRASSSTYAATAYSIGLSENTYLQQDAVGVAALRFGTQPHLLRVYSTYSSASVYSRASLTPTTTAVTLAAEELGTGSANIDIVLTPAGTGAVQAKSGLIAGAAAVESVALAYAGEYGVRMFSSASLRWTAGNLAAGIDTALRRSAAGVLDVDSGTATAYRDLKLRNLLVNPVAFASLTAAATAGNGARSHINNCSHSTFGTAADGGGAISVPVWSNGTSWLVG